MTMTAVAAQSNAAPAPAGREGVESRTVCMKVPNGDPQNNSQQARVPTIVIENPQASS